MANAIGQAKNGDNRPMHTALAGDQKKRTVSVLVRNTLENSHPVEPDC